MAWNQPKDGNKGKTKPKGGKHGMTAIIAIAAISALAGVAFFVLRQVDVDDHIERSNIGKKALISDVKPTTNIVAKVDVPAAPKPKPDPNARPTKVGEVVNGYVMLPSGRIHKPTGVVTNRVASYGKSKYSIFEHRSDNEIAAVIMMTPGDTIVGTKRYDRWFTQQFLNSIKTPIIATADDEPWQADLKRLVNQARLELKEAYDNGEDIDAIMTESRQQLQDLAKYKHSIKQIYAQNIKECETKDDVKGLQRAVNIMLEDKGCAPINFTPLTKLNLMKDKQRE